MKAQRGRHIASRDYRLTVGALFLAVVITVTVCTAVSLVAIGHSTRQTSEAIDAAITAYDRYLQQISAGQAWSRELAALDSDGLLEEMPAELAQVAATGDADMRAALLAPLQRRIAAFEEETSATSRTLYLLFPDAGAGQQGAGGEDGAAQARAVAQGTLVGASYAGALAGAPDARLSQIDVMSSIGREAGASHLVERSDGSLGMTRYGEAAPGCVLISFSDLPELPGLEVLSPISDLTELYFVDSLGHAAGYQSGGEYAGLLSFEALDTGDGSASGIVELESGGARYRAYYHDLSAGHLKFCLVTPDVAQQARRELMAYAVAAGVVLAALGCALGAALTRRVYAPLRRIIARLAPLDRAEQDEFQLVGLAIRTLEQQLDEQAPAVEGYHLARILHGQAELPREAEGFFFGDAGEGAPALCAVVAVRPDERCDLGALEAAVRRRLEAAGRRHAACQDAGMAVVVADASGGGVEQAADRVRKALQDEDGFLASAFVSGARPAPDGLAACYREVLDMVELKGAAAFCQTLSYAHDMPSAGRAAPAAQQAGPAPEFSDVLAYVQANYRDPGLSAGKLARVFGMSQPQVSRLFKRNGFDGFLTCLHGLRVAEAKRLLRDGGMSVAEVAQAVGYSSVVTMTRAFKRYTGQTPGEFRAQ